MKHLVSIFVFAVFLVSIVNGNVLDRNLSFNDRKIRGKIVDENGGPEIGGYVVLEKTSYVQAEELVEYAVTDNAGEFSLYTSWRKQMKLYATNAIPPAACLLLFPPYNYLYAIKNCHGVPIPKGGGDVDVGAVKYTTIYGLFRIHMVRSDGRAPFFTEGMSLYPLQVRVRALDGSEVQETGFSERNVDFTQSTALLGLPQGDWKLEFSRDFGKSWRTIPGLFQVKGVQEINDITFVVGE